MSYSGSDEQTLGIVLTPKHITELFCDLLNIKPDDVVLYPCCGTAGFLIAAMRNMLKQAKNDAQRKHIKKEQLHGIELQPYMFTIATTNMILRGDGNPVSYEAVVHHIGVYVGNGNDAKVQKPVLTAFYCQKSCCWNNASN